MEFSKAERFYNLFKPRENSHGETTYNGTQDDRGKVEVSCRTIHMPATVDHINLHLEGEKSIGLAPLNIENNCLWAAIDVDVYPFDIVEFSKRIYALPVPMFPCRSKSGGVHVFVFFQKEIKAATVIKHLKELALIIRIASSEIFPKSENAKPESTASWINLPYYDAWDTARYCVLNGETLSLDAFLDAAEKGKIKDLEKACKELELWSCPPCIQRMRAEGVQKGYRDSFLLALGVFLKQKYPESVEEKLRAYNDEMDDPLNEGELYRAILTQVMGKDLFYSCSGAISAWCNKEECRGREFGIGKKNSAERLLGDMVKINSTPPVWRLTIKGIVVNLDTEDMLNQAKFKIKCVEAAHIIPPTMDSNDWYELLQTKLDNITVIDAPDDANRDADLFQYIRRFMVERGLARNTHDVFDKDMVLVDVKQAKNIFTSSALRKYLKRNGVTRYQGNELWNKLEPWGIEAARRRHLGEAVTLWSLPLLPGQMAAAMGKEDGADTHNSIKDQLNEITDAEKANNADTENEGEF